MQQALAASIAEQSGQLANLRAEMHFYLFLKTLRHHKSTYINVKGNQVLLEPRVDLVNLSHK